MFGDFSERQLEKIISVKLVRSGYFKEAVEYGTGIVIGFDKGDIFPPYSEGMDHMLGIVVGELYIAVIKTFPGGLMDTGA